MPRLSPFAYARSVDEAQSDLLHIVRENMSSSESKGVSDREFTVVVRS
jgi:hypothetical protein